jgi:hypothetical protein
MNAAASRFASSREQRALWSVFAVALLAIAATAWWLFRSRAKLGTDGWFLEPNAPWPLGAWGLPLAVLLIFGGLAAVSAYDRFHRAKNRSEQVTSMRMSIIALVLLSLGWNWTLLGPSGTIFGARSGSFNAIAALWSDLATEYFGVAYQVENPRLFSREYAAKWQNPPSALQAHVATHPPGAVLFYYGVRRLVESSSPLQSTLTSLAERSTGESASVIASQANELRFTAARVANAPQPPPLPLSAVAAALGVCIVISLMLALTVPALYGLVAHNTSDDPEAIAVAEARGLIAAALWVLAPTTGLFAFTLDAVIACGAAWVLWSAAKYFQGGNRGWMIGAGIVLAFTCFLSLGALTVGAIIAFWAALLRAPHKQWRQLLFDTVWIGSGFFVAWLVILIVFPMQLPLIIGQGLAAHRMATLTSRTSPAWLGLNFFSFFLFAGWPLIAAFGAQLLSTVRRRLSELDVTTSLGLATLLALLLITFGGSVRGETERLWLPFLAPFCIVAASWFGSGQAAAKLEDSKSRRWLVPAMAWSVLLLMQAVQTLLMAGTLAPLVMPL